VPSYYALRCYVVRSSQLAVQSTGAQDPSLLILTSLAGGPKHGHALAGDIESFAGVRLGPGTLYGAITRLEERGLIAPLEPDGRRRPYELTVAGSAALTASMADLRRIVDTGAQRLRLAGGMA
jgi:DNA-binding PadR family transcriptional regulator